MLVGTNTRAVSKSLKDLGYVVYATSFYKCIDQFVDKLLVPDDTTNFNLKLLEDIALDYVDDVDYIIFTSDVNTSRFPKNKVIGNYDNSLVNNKYKLYKFLYKNFLLPETYRLDSLDEASEIVNSNPDKKYLIKPIAGFGGLGIKWFDNNLSINGEFLLQEYISGDAVSSYFLSYPNHELGFITTSEQIIGSKQLGADDFTYCGNISPYIKTNPKIDNISAKIARMCKLVGSNGVDFIVSNNNVYVLEVNPRITGSFECIENSFNMNLVKEHINSCNNVSLKVPKMNRFCVKLIPYSINQGTYSLNNISNIHDVSPENYYFNKKEPIATIVTYDRILENAMGKAQRIQKLVYNTFKK